MLAVDTKSFDALLGHLKILHEQELAELQMQIDLMKDGTYGTSSSDKKLPAKIVNEEVTMTEEESNLNPEPDAKGQSAAEEVRGETDKDDWSGSEEHTPKLEIARSPSSSSMLHKKRISQLQTKRDCKSLRALLKGILEDGYFEIIIASCIMASAIVMCFEVQHKGIQLGYDLDYRGCVAKGDCSQSEDTWPGAADIFIFFDWMFGILFWIEALAKILCFASGYFCDLWNLLDFGCCLAFAVDKASSVALPLDAYAIRMLRIARLARLVRLVRALESIDHLYIMTTALKGSAGVLGWAIVLLAIMLMAVSLLLTQILHATYFDDMSVANLTLDQLQTHQKMYEYFGSFTRCLLSAFEMSLANWTPVTRLLSENASEWCMALCLIHKLTLGFAVIGVINGVILQETFKVAATDDWVMVRQKRRAGLIMRKKMMDLFQSIDRGGDGHVSFAEFEMVGKNSEVKTWLSSMDIETDDLHTLFHLIDDDDTGHISAQELAHRMPRIKGAARSIDVLAMAQKLDHALAKRQISF
jgi:hypothetical protein